MSSRVLAADDSGTVRAMLRLALESSGYDATVVSDGREVLEALQGGAFDLVLLDLNMPNMDGLEALEQIRRTWHTLPVALLTTVSESDARERATALGATAYFTKPFKPSELLREIEALLRTA